MIIWNSQKSSLGGLTLFSPPCQAEMATQKIKFMQMLVTGKVVLGLNTG